MDLISRCVSAPSNQHNTNIIGRGQSNMAPKTTTITHDNHPTQIDTIARTSVGVSVGPSDRRARQKSSSAIEMHSLPPDDDDDEEQH